RSIAAFATESPGQRSNSATYSRTGSTRSYYRVAASLQVAKQQTGRGPLFLVSNARSIGAERKDWPLLDCFGKVRRVRNGKPCTFLVGWCCARFVRRHSQFGRSE